MDRWIRPATRPAAGSMRPRVSPTGTWLVAGVLDLTPRPATPVSATCPTGVVYTSPRDDPT